MFREMRRKKQKLTEKQCIDILKRAKTATLALHGDDGYPYSVPHSDSFPRHPLSRSPSRFLGESILPTGGGLSPSFNSVTIPLLK
ncbi:MAG: hypothetical protein EGR78_09855 [Erysipelotrichaceae bacterium]|nr:hypothetical protein [Erysipelotrichaceae bacterium]